MTSPLKTSSHAETDYDPDAGAPWIDTSGQHEERAGTRSRRRARLEDIDVGPHLPGDGIITHPLTERPFADWDEGDHLSFALAGLMRLASSALAVELGPGPRGWIEGYPETLAEDLDFWVEIFRAADINAEGKGLAYAAIENGTLLVDTVCETSGMSKIRYLAHFTGDYTPEDFSPVDGGLSPDTEFERYPDARIVPVQVSQARGQNRS